MYAGAGDGGVNWRFALLIVALLLIGAGAAYDCCDRCSDCAGSSAEWRGIDRAGVALRVIEPVSVAMCRGPRSGGGAMIVDVVAGVV